ncbi:uncharacterized protein LOC119545724 [Drosophila subpulchrella]|uniref:uncharacterized protein LOC119545724 n=1 Tax=Drosophila subpulchrella TaxID=1486046 RepID=UPI0018A14F1B|nr:uncharacterized protein LOC119545724 [Drosophila subpulchrella]
MQPSIIFLLGCFAFANSFSIDLGFLNPLRIPGESAVDASLCKPIVRINTERDSFQPNSMTNNPGDVTTRRFLVPLPTLAPSSTSTTTRIYDKNFPNPMVDCDPVPISVGRQLGTNLLGIFQTLG